MAENKDALSIQLLEQRVASAEQWRNDDAVKIEELQREAAELRGRMSQQERTNQSALKLAGPAVGIVASIVATIIGGVLWEGMEKNAAEISRIDKVKSERLTRLEQQAEVVHKHVEDEGHPDKMIARLDVLDAQIQVMDSSLSSKASKSSVASLQAAMDAHASEFAHPDATVSLTRIEERLDTIDREQVTRQARLQRIEASTIGLESSMQTLQAGYIEHEEELDAAEINIQDLDNRVSSTQASTSAAFVEVETQIRAWVDTSNLRAAYQHSQMQQLSVKIDPGEPIPDLEFFPERIPAQATTQVGKINGN